MFLTVHESDAILTGRTALNEWKSPEKEKKGKYQARNQKRNHQHIYHSTGYRYRSLCIACSAWSSGCFNMGKEKYIAGERSQSTSLIDLSAIWAVNVIPSPFQTSSPSPSLLCHVYFASVEFTSERGVKVEIWGVRPDRRIKCHPRARLIMKTKIRNILPVLFSIWNVVHEAGPLGRDEMRWWDGPMDNPGREPRLELHQARGRGGRKIVPAFPFYSGSEEV